MKKMVYFSLAILVASMALVPVARAHDNDWGFGNRGCREPRRVVVVRPEPYWGNGRALGWNRPVATWRDDRHAYYAPQYAQPRWQQRRGWW
jgi:hypothetical protein